LWLSLANVSAASPPGPATVYTNAVIFTARADRPDATWFVVQDGKIADVGSGERPARWRDAKVTDLGGRFVAPGFVDAHLHLVDGGLSLLQEDVSDARDLAAVEASVRRAAAAPHALPHDWVVIRNLGLDLLGGATPDHARMARFTALTGERPLLVLLKGGHHAYASPRALARLRLTRASAGAHAGTLGRDSRGELPGLMATTVRPPGPSKGTDEY
jgi:predicted amidohydrolase YtcJ